MRLSEDEFITVRTLACIIDTQATIEEDENNIFLTLCGNKVVFKHFGDICMYLSGAIMYRNIVEEKQ